MGVATTRGARGTLKKRGITTIATNGWGATTSRKQQHGTIIGKEQQVGNKNEWGVVIGGKWPCIGKNNHGQTQARKPMRK